MLRAHPINLAVAGLIACCAAALPTAPAAADTGTVTVELNKLEAADGACRAYIVLQNGTPSRFDTLKLDLVMFDSDGVVTKRLAADMAPLPPAKTKLKAFDIDGISCAGIGRLLLNDVLACSDGSGDRKDCLDLISTSSRGTVPFDE